MARPAAKRPDLRQRAVSGPAAPGGARSILRQPVRSAPGAQAGMGPVLASLWQPAFRISVESGNRASAHHHADRCRFRFTGNDRTLLHGYQGGRDGRLSLTAIHRPRWPPGKLSTRPSRRCMMAAFSRRASCALIDPGSLALNAVVPSPEPPRFEEVEDIPFPDLSEGLA